MKKWMTLGLTLLLSGSLIACGTSPQASQQPPSSTAGEHLPQEKKIEFTMEGMKEEEKATLKHGSFDYTLYVMERFSLDFEEPGKDVLLTDIDPDFFARIEKLDPSIQVASYKEQLMNSLMPTGKVHDLHPEQIFEPYFHDAPFYLLVESEEHPVNLIYLAKTLPTGQTFVYTIHMPLKESAEGITSRLWAILKTVTPTK
ncbi:hypothetical protein [Ammoniphilus sp. YIM 78166]|uniref:hypothetical protein n=1 Tax=Ammoniphilus sp. YIM 78166 TaxID=1644106 RepID=UPI00106FFC6D|nr:hypothetical protein [Ammoniphilus sp. YIM 78166]